MQDINESKKEEIVLNANREINYGKIQVDPSNYINNEDENKFKYMLRQIREKRNFNFGTRDINYFKKIKNPIISFDKRKKENDNQRPTEGCACACRCIAQISRYRQEENLHQGYRHGYWRL